jgi:hypothetical protein
MPPSRLDSQRPLQPDQHSIERYPRGHPEPDVLRYITHLARSLMHCARLSDLLLMMLSGNG